MILWCKLGQFPAFCTVLYNLLYFTVYDPKAYKCSTWYDRVDHLIVYLTVSRTGTTLVYMFIHMHTLSTHALHYDTPCFYAHAPGYLTSEA
jgi:hypothetical protein